MHPYTMQTYDVIPRLTNTGGVVNKPAYPTFEV